MNKNIVLILLSLALFDLSQLVAALPDSGEKSWFDAAKSGDAEVMKNILDKDSGFKVDVVDRDGLTALNYAVKEGHAAVVRFLLSVQDPDRFVIKGDRSTLLDGVYSGVVPLCQAARRGNLEIVRLLVGAGANINEINRDDNSPLMCALVGEKDDVATFLVQKGASLAKTDNPRWDKMIFDIQQKLDPKREKRVSEIKDEIELRKKVVTLLLKEREKSPDSPFYKENLPREILEEIMVRSGLIKTEKERRAEQERKQKQ